MYYCYALLLALVHPVLCDYRLEVELVQYTGTGLLGDGSCCDLDLGDNRCSASDTCDLDFLFRIQNIGNQQVNLNAQTKGAGRYIDANLINFVNCEELPTTTSVAASNPLTFDIPSSSWSNTEQLRVTFSARDYDPPVGAGSPSFGEIGSPFIDFDRPSAPNELFSDMMSPTNGGATISYRYRIICTDGSCGNDCSQTVNCPQWSSACGDGISTFTTQAPNTDPSSPTDPCSRSPSPCLNGGLCMGLSSVVYQCDCTSTGFEGINCETRSTLQTDAPLTTTMMQTTDSTTTTTTSMTSIANDNQGSPDPVGCDASRRMASYWLIVCAVALLIETLM